jgi:ATP-dependent RNA helicase DeaD
MIPLILAGKDVIGQAKTGTGKTASFGLPVLHLSNPEVSMETLVLTPTRELAAQVAGEINDLGQFTPIRAVCIVGGESMRAQSKAVKDGGHIIVGTPGRVMDMQERGEIHFKNIRYIVLDEVDRMLDIGFREDIRKILSLVKTAHQTIFCSATISGEIERLARSYMKPDVEKIVTVSGALTVALVDQKYLSVQPWDKRTLLLHLLRHEKPDTTVVFCRTKATVHRVATYLKEKGIDAREIHGDLAQNKRNKVLETLREGKLDVLVASDLAARGLDIEHISHVINYDLPEDPDIYVHRIGRTARAGRKGVAWSFVMPDQGQMLTEIEKLTGVEIPKLDYPDFTPGPVPEDMRSSLPSNRERPDPMVTLAARTAPLVPEGWEEFTPEQIKQMFPDGNVPKNAPRKTLGSKFRSQRHR